MNEESLIVVLLAYKYLKHYNAPNINVYILN